MSDVTVIGLGAVGSAIANALLGAGLRVTVWNRTASRTGPVAEAGAEAAAAPEAAIQASPLSIVCIDGYRSTLGILEQPAVCDVVAGRTLVQFSTGTPREAREGERWAKKHGAHWLGGAILAYPREIGHSALVFVAGDGAVFGGHRPVLGALTDELRYLGDAVGAAAALDLAVLSYYIASHLGLTHGALICESEHVDPEVMTSVIVDSLPSDAAEIAHLGRGLTRNDFSGAGASLGVYSGILDRLLVQARDARINAEIPRFANELVKRGMAAGLGDEEVVSIIRVLRRKH